MSESFPDRPCSNPECQTPGQQLNAHQQFGPGEAPPCWECANQVRSNSQPPRPGKDAPVPKETERLL